LIKFKNSGNQRYFLLINVINPFNLMNLCKLAPILPDILSQKKWLKNHKLLA